METALERLRAATEHVHSRLESLPYAVAVLDGTVSLAAYGGFLRAVAVMHEGLERVLSTTSEPLLLSLRQVTSPHSPALARDLESLGEDRFRVDPPALLAELFNQRLRWFARRDPLALAGVLYVLEGSLLGGVVQASRLRHRAEFAGGGLEYLCGNGRNAAAAFQAFVERLNATLTDAAAVESAVRGATATFETFEKLFSSLMSEITLRKPGIALLNPEAGTHVIPADLREIAAALRAGEETWQRYAYYGARYGERGLRFTRSDSAWLATLARYDGDQTVHEVIWLGRVLAHRGMPRFLLEEHLGVLHAELCRSLPDACAAYGSLQRAQEYLRAERDARIEPSEFARLASELEADIPPDLRGVLRGSGVLPVAAVIDGACGLKGAAPSLAGWLADPQRFPQRWVERVRAAFADASVALALEPQRPDAQSMA